MTNYFVTVKVRAVILHEGKILLAKLSNVPYGANFYCLPGGTLEPGESRLEWLHREIIEELGVEPVIGKLVYTQEILRDTWVTSVDFWYQIENPQDFLNVDITQASHGFEHELVGFFDRSTAPEWVVKPLNIWDLLDNWKEDPKQFLGN